MTTIQDEQKGPFCLIADEFPSDASDPSESLEFEGANVGNVFEGTSSSDVGGMVRAWLGASVDGEALTGCLLGAGRGVKTGCIVGAR
jgi:hypothetical protein